MSEFLQEPPRLTNTFESNRWLKAYLHFKLPKEMFTHIEGDLHRLGQLCAGEYLDLARAAEREKPVLVPYDPWGKRTDEIRVSHAWKHLHDISAMEGMVAIGYKRAYGEFSRVYQFAKLYLFHPSSAFYTCPLAMTDGAARVMELYGKDDVHKQAYSHLTSDSPQEFWTSGQWMTERPGGSDVSNSETRARVEGGQTRLYGVKWFSSATTSEIALALARPEGASEGSRGLTLYLVPVRNADGSSNNIRVLRLKDKLGTWALPTAELQLEGAIAYQVGDRDQGVKTVANMLNITRLYNSITSCGQMTRGLEMLRDYSGKRKAFGARLSDHVLHFSTFAREELKALCGLLLTMEMVHLMGKEECGTATGQDSEILRLMTPVAKLFTAKAAVQVASETIEGFGGAGYIEDTGIPVHLRDSQVFSIWEGATNILSLDLMRVLQKTQALVSLSNDIQARLKFIRSEELSAIRDQMITHLREFEKQAAAFTGMAQDQQTASSRDLAFYLARMYGFILLLDWAERETAERRAQLMPWIRLYQSDYLGKWKQAGAEELSAARAVWSGSITL